MAQPLERDVGALARRLAAPGLKRHSAILRSSWWSERMLEWAMSHPSFKTELFRFVDVLPSTTGSADVMRHLSEYFAAGELPPLLDLGLELAEHLPLGSAAAAAIARRQVAAIAHQFIAGRDPAEAVPALRRLWERGSAFTLDLLGERTVTEAEADGYAARLREVLVAVSAAAGGWPPNPRLESDDLGDLPRMNLSVKPSALASLYGPLTAAEGLGQALGRLTPLLREAQRLSAFVNLDMEQVEVRELTLELLRRVLADPELENLHLGITLQAYLVDAAGDLEELIGLSAGRARPLTVRLVKGAYWDTEVVVARAEGWPLPVHRTKAETDAAFERCSDVLHAHHGEVRAAFGSHNARSLAHAVASARERGIPDSGYEIQTLHGMAGPIDEAVRRLGVRHRVYTPIGELVPGMAYLVRRLLENTADEGFVRRRFVEGTDLESLVAPPAPPPPRADGPGGPGTTDPSATAPFHREPPMEWRRASVRSRFAEAVSGLGLGGEVPAFIAGRPVRCADSIESLDPADPDTVVAVAAACGEPEAEAAVEAGLSAGPRWARAPCEHRAGVLFRAAAWMRERRGELAALEVFEAGKPWAEADADVCEAIDFLEFYGRLALRLDRGGPVESPAGERNALRYQPRGLVLVISPWNFPLAIPAGAVAAALVTGNAVLFKPAEQTPAVAARLVQALQAGGLPDGVLALLPGRGAEVGAHLVRHPEVGLVAFTGSLEVGLEINAAAAVQRSGQRLVRRVIAEMGGKNAIIVDADADLDQAIPLVVASAFGHAGQKCSACSRLIVLDAVHDQVVERLVGATRVLRIGHPREAGVQVGPLIDDAALERVRSYVDVAAREGSIVLRREDLPPRGHFAGPTIVTGVGPRARVATEEIFGPVLAVMRAADFDEAMDLANSTDYALTAGLVSRSPSHIERAATELRAGNVYINRAITGAVVGRHPFGGHGLSGVGAKAGGPDYLLQFVDARSVSENTLRQGFAPADEAADAAAPQQRYESG